MSTKKIGSTMTIIAIVGLIAILTLLFSERIEDYRNPNRTVESLSAPGGAATIVLHRNRYGHYVANGEINGITTELMLDTGATDVAVSEDSATTRKENLQAGIFFGRFITSPLLLLIPASERSDCRK